MCLCDRPGGWAQRYLWHLCGKRRLLWYLQCGRCGMLFRDMLSAILYLVLETRDQRGQWGNRRLFIFFLSFRTY